MDTMRLENFTILVPFAVLNVVSPLPAHGGQYRGPSDVKPPATDTSGGGSSSSGGNTSGGSGGTSTTGGGSSGGSQPGSSPRPIGGKARGAALDDDLGRWEYWWEFGKDPWLRLRDAIYGNTRGNDDDAWLNRHLVLPRANVERPQPKDLEQVVAALAATLQQNRDRDTVSACMVALAKIGQNPKDAPLRQLCLPWLHSGDQELRETAALALGIAGQLEDETLELLRALIMDSPEGRRVSGGSAVNERTRAFAAFASGLLLRRCEQADLCRRLTAPLLDVIDRPADHGRDLQVAAIEALSLLPDLPANDGDNLRAKVLAKLGAYYDLELGPGDRLLQAHVPPAIARILRPTDPEATAWKARLLADLRAGIDTAGGAKKQQRGANLFLAQSCALALGGLAQPWNADSDADAPIGAALSEAYRQHRDQQTRSFALLSLARMGGSKARALLLVELARANRAIEQPWCAMALGVLQARAIEQGFAAGHSPEPDRELAAALDAAFQAARNPSSQGALAIALGLAGEAGAADKLRAALLEHRQRDDVVGYVALALGLLRDTRAIPELRALVQGASRRPFVMVQGVRALGLIGDQSVAAILCAELEQPDTSLVKLSALASALGQIGDRRSFAPLLRVLGNEKQLPLTRAFAAVALGSIGDKDPLPWNSVFATNTNYRASTDTLTDGSSGILDIL